MADVPSNQPIQPQVEGQEAPALDQPLAPEQGGQPVDAGMGGAPRDRGGRGGGGGRGRGGGGGRGRGGGGRERRSEDGEGGFDDIMVKLYRCSKVVKGGRRFTFGSLVVVGDRRGQVAVGYGKANEVPAAVEKAVKLAKRSLCTIPLHGTTIPHRIWGRFGASKILLIPASAGTGVIAGSAARAVLQLAGVKDVLTKSYGSTNAKNLVKATIAGLQGLRTRKDIEAIRGVRVDLPKKKLVPTGVVAK